MAAMIKMIATPRSATQSVKNPSVSASRFPFSLPVTFVVVIDQLPSMLALFSPEAKVTNVTPPQRQASLSSTARFARNLIVNMRGAQQSPQLTDCVGAASFSVSVVISQRLVGPLP